MLPSSGNHSQEVTRYSIVPNNNGILLDDLPPRPAVTLFVISMAVMIQCADNASKCC